MKIPEILSSKLVYTGFIKIEKALLDIGGKTFTREKVVNKNSVGVLLFDKHKLKLVFLKQYRFPINDVVIEIPAGQIDPGFTARETAIKEVKEETGITITDEDLFYLTSYYPAIGTSTEKINIFYALIDIDKIEKREEDVENLQSEIMIVKIPEVFEMIQSEEIKDGKSLLAWHIFNTSYLKEYIINFLNER